MTEKTDNLKKLVIPDYIYNELNFINKGIISYYLDNRLYFFYISDQESLDITANTNNITLELDTILRDEFPSVRVIFTFFLDNLRVSNIDYYFNLESDEEIQHLHKLYEDGSMIFILYNHSIKHIKEYRIKNDDLISIGKALFEIDTMVDKTSQFKDNKPSN